MCKKFFSAIEGISSKTQTPSPASLIIKLPGPGDYSKGGLTLQRQRMPEKPLQPQIKVPQKSALAVTSPSRINTVPSPPPHKKCTFFSTAKAPTPGEQLWNRLLSYLRASAKREAGKNRTHTHTNTGK